MITTRTITGNTFSGIIILLMALFLFGCGGSDHYRSENNNSEKAVLQGKLVGKNIYEKLLTKDKKTIQSCLSKTLQNDADSIIAILTSRDENWGKFISFEVTDVSSTEIFTDKGDTTTFYVNISAIYENNRSSDLLTIEKVKKTVFKIVDYQLDNEEMLNCGIYEIQNLIPVYNAFTEAFVRNDTSEILTMCGGHGAFYDSVMKIQHETFSASVTIDSIVHLDGYMRNACGLYAEANGLMAFSIYTSDTTELQIIYKLRKDEGSMEYDMYSLLLTNDLEIDTENDVNFAKSIAKDVYKIIQKKDGNAFYNTFHTELSSLYDESRLKELDEVVSNLKSLGKFVDYYTYYTFRTSDNDFMYFVVILRLEDEEGYSNYLEMVFKPDANNKFMLINCNELYH